MSSNKEKRVKKKIITLKNKGFTLVELLGVVAILSVIMGISIMSFTSVKKNTLKQQYDNIVSLIETEAANYANKTGITTVSVEKLILEGYLEPDDETDIYNPQNNASLNCHIVNSTFSDGEYASTMSETNLRKDDGTCDEYKVTSEYEICQMSGSSCITIPDNKWFNSDVTLGVKHTRTGRIIDTSTARFEWSSTTGNMGTGSTITASTTTVIQSTFKVKLITTDNKLGEATQLVKIDRQNPVVVGVSVDTAWSTEKKVIVTANDFTGSGVKGIYVGTETTCRSNMPYQTANNNKIILEKEDGEYYACAIDNVGNFSNTAYRIKVDNSDTEGADTISLTPNPATWANKIELIGKAQDLKSGLVAYQFIETRKTQIPPDDPNWIFDIPDAERNSEITRIRPDVTDETKTYYFWVLDMMGNTSVASYKPDKLDKKGAETISLTPNSTRQAKSLTLTGQATDTKSGIVKYQITMSSIEPRTGWKTAATPQKLVTDTLDVNKNGTYYFWVIDAAGNRDKVSYNVSNIDNEGPKLVDPGTAFPEEPQGVIIPPNYTDPSGPVSYYYRVQENDPSRPNPEDPSQWSTSRNFRTSCGNNYYVWIKAVDALGNYTLTYVGNYPSKDCCNERNRLNSTCDYPGYYTDYYRNECNGKTWTERSNDPCNWETPIGEEDERCVGDDLRIEWEECYGGRCDIRTRTKYDHPKCYTPSEPQRPSGGKSCGKVCVGDYLCDEVDESDCSCGHIDRSRNCDGSSSNSGSNNGGNNGGSSDKDKGIQAVPKCSDSSYLSGYYSYQCYPYKEGVGYQIGGKWNNFTDACWKGVGLGHYNYLCYYCENSQYPTFYTSSEAYPMCR